ncbi:hypothetical protein SAMN05216421_0505 [Halopseudomonas xinjiangensis]|uniref:PglD N-terminal domain-containing protein n=1 Tax=Halopseudomonas xinjiangensis TaxID=487184 RepID=A0A1H1MNI0_9GAMM|nr:NeuD/PglB/VioB family sugar acetyltransferase [Halopseudomonas xinjiangensis]SDR88170.1 hypothetical protein SAMN05216421_0505 [Halopseudomonas xinjiangensis]
MERFAIIGAGGFGREVMCYAESMLSGQYEGNFETIFALEGRPDPSVLHGYKVVDLQDIISGKADISAFSIAIADGVARERIAGVLEESGIKPFSVISTTSLVFERASLGRGAIVSPYSIVSPDTRIGEYVHLNYHSYVAHDCVIGNYVTFAPGVKCNGGVVVEDHAYIGTGAMIKNSASVAITIGKGATVGMGAVVTKSVPAGSVVIGNPARVIR